MHDLLIKHSKTKIELEVGKGIFKIFNNKLS